MRGLTASELLDAYERGRRAGAAERALVLLDAAGVGATSAPDELTVGRRNALLLDVREATFGGDVQGVVACPGCGEQLELSFAVGDLRLGASERGAEAAPGWRTLDVDAFEVRFRPPTAGDLVAIEDQTDPVAARRTLVQRCVQVRRIGGRSLTRVPSAVLRRVDQELSAADPGAIADLVVWCPTCRKRRTVAFDVPVFVWDEIEARVPRLLLEIHELASAYGWAESEVLAMSPWRRTTYAAMVHA